MKTEALLLRPSQFEYGDYTGTPEDTIGRKVVGKRYRKGGVEVHLLNDDGSIGYVGFEGRRRYRIFRPVSGTELNARTRKASA